ncbi:hypothetical protein AG4045_024955 [Apium graveolens]|uniref:NADH dehydrogenase [ubiquinone] iron-sulfur protein 5 n=1 Tax=Apium graveolens TaxID=4045 RepID=A0A6L5BB58_APIGR|nr:hypothetical protein AG4045_024955 [Apium graveolens]
MASGWGITGSKGRCYDFWMDFSECMSRCREPKDCSLLREDYCECLHHSKERLSTSISLAGQITGITEVEVCWYEAASFRQYFAAKSRPRKANMDQTIILWNSVRSFDH